MINIDFFNLFIQHRFSVPSHWKWTQLDAGHKHHRALSEGRMRITGGSGADVLSAEISKSEFDAFKEQWERENQSCHQCYGEGMEISSVSVKHGTTYRKCSRCCGSGVYKEVANA